MRFEDLRQKMRYTGKRKEFQVVLVDQVYNMLYDTLLFLVTLKGH